MEDFLEEATLEQGGKGEGWTQREDQEAQEARQPPVC